MNPLKKLAEENTHFYTLRGIYDLVESKIAGAQLPDGWEKGVTFYILNKENMIKKHKERLKEMERDSRQAMTWLELLTE